MIRKIIHITLVALVPLLLLVLLGFAASKNKKTPCLELSVSVLNINNHRFVDAEKLKAQIIRELPSIEGHPVKNTILRDINEIVLKNPYVKRSSVFRTIDGNVKVEVTQREPLIRLFNAHNQGYYIDIEGKPMPLSNYYTARVLLAGGHIYSSYSKDLDLTQTLNSEEASSNEKTLANLFKLASFIKQNPFWDAFIDYIHIKPGNKFELTPKNGAHVVEFGTIEQMEEKFQKLETFYLNGLSVAGWDKYSRLNVKYKNQVVCSK
jgi:cell division protein FtsQ